jgi:hypothetical protein
VRAEVTIFSKRFLTQREEDGVNIQSSLEPLAALITLIEMIARRQQLRGR